MNDDTMPALVIAGRRLRLQRTRPLPQRRAGEARVRVLLAGICGTDLQVLRGYAGFRGVLGHEFVGVVDRCGDPRWIGRRVVGDINLACRRCRECRAQRSFTIRGDKLLLRTQGEFVIVPEANAAARTLAAALVFEVANTEGEARLVIENFPPVQLRIPPVAGGN